MAGFFSLGRGGSDDQHNSNNPPPPEHHNHHQIAPETLFWYKNEDVANQSYKGFELWQQQEQLLQLQTQPPPRLYQPHPHHHQDLYASAAALGVGPSSRGSDDTSSSRSGAAAFTMMRSSSGGRGGGGGGPSCQDCGNQSKKDCIHMRCRTCCKNRGSDCPTHVKSTWVPASKRRERQQQLAALQHQHHQHHQDHIQQHHDQQQQQQRQQLPVIRGESSKRLRQNPSSNPSLRILTNTNTSGLDVVNFPPEVSSPAVFRCVKVSAMDDEDQYAYQTAVNIAGHLFKGILYDQGPESPNYNMNMAAETSSGGGVNFQPLNLIAGATTAVNTASIDGGGGQEGVAVAGSTTVIDPSSLYPAPINTYMGTQFFPPPRS